MCVCVGVGGWYEPSSRGVRACACTCVRERVRVGPPSVQKLADVSVPSFRSYQIVHDPLHCHAVFLNKAEPTKVWGGMGANVVWCCGVAQASTPA